MALGAMSEYNTENIKIVPVGLNYFNRNRFRSEVIVEFGKAFEVPREWANEFKVNKKDSTEKLLKEIEYKMKYVTLTAPTYIELRAVFFVRKLYIPPNITLSPAQFTELCKRFCKSYEKLKDKDETKALLTKVNSYVKELESTGINDSQVKKMDFTSAWLLKKTLSSLCLLLFFLVISLPGLLLFGPFGYYIRKKGEKERIAAKIKNPNKLEGLDVVSSVKVTYAIILLPLMMIIWIIVGQMFCNLFW